MKNLIAIDPGANGGLAHLRHGQTAQAYRMPPTEGDLLVLLREFKRVGRGIKEFSAILWVVGIWITGRKVT